MEVECDPTASPEEVALWREAEELHSKFQALNVAHPGQDAAEIKALKKEDKDAKKDAKVAKDDACASRFGGKALCIRPFDSGY